MRSPRARLRPRDASWGPVPSTAPFISVPGQASSTCKKKRKGLLRGPCGNPPPHRRGWILIPELPSPAGKPGGHGGAGNVVTSVTSNQQFWGDSQRGCYGRAAGRLRARGVVILPLPRAAPGRGAPVASSCCAHPQPPRHGEARGEPSPVSPWGMSPREMSPPAFPQPVAATPHPGLAALSLARLLFGKETKINGKTKCH